MKELISQIKESTVFFGLMRNNEPVFSGTGFLIQVDDVFYVATAKHVVENNYQQMFIFLNNKNFGVNFKPIEEILSQGFSWKKHGNNNVDIALLPFPLAPQLDKAKFIPNSLFINDISEIQELVDLFFLSFQPGINELKNDNSINPIIRKGVISRINHDKTFFMDGFAFPGNSGSPVFLLPTPVKIKNNSIQIGGPVEIKLAGVIGAYVPYRDEAISRQTGEVRAIFTENTGIALVHSTALLQDIIRSDDFQEQHKKLTKANKITQAQNPLQTSPEISQM
ncbi:MAG: trypsin-like peptidase domain-containing protein [Candidatus Moraniibacteriota bacterium]|nr:MAG: trypsin-like peptidase domain-containing protein [Candidatus Moranbacteria bacterium]